MADKKAAKPEAKADKRGNAHDRIDALVELLERNGISIPKGLR